MNLRVSMAVLLLGAACAQPPGKLDVFAKPVNIFDDGEETTITILATQGDGKIGSGTVTLASSIGTLGATTLTIDAYGSAKTTYSCNAEVIPLCSGVPATIIAEWSGVRTSLQVRVKDKCPGGETCDGQCVDINSDWFNCGGCGVKCASDQACLGGSCQACPQGDDCDSDGWRVSEGDCCDQYDQCSKPKVINPAAVEAPANMVDDDCNGLVDAADPQFAGCDSMVMAPLTLDPKDFARTLGLCRFTTEAERSWGVISSELLLVDGSGPAPARSATIRPVFGTIPPQEGGKLLVLATHTASDAWQTNPSLSDGTGNTSVDISKCLGPGCIQDWFAANRPPTKLANRLPSAPNCGGGDQNEANDSVMLRLRIRAPSNANSFRLKTRFFSIEYPEYVCSSFNDQMVLLIDTPTNVGNPPDKNLMAYSVGDGGVYPVGINLAAGTPLFQTCQSKASAPMCWDDAVSPASCGGGPDELARTQFGGPDGGCTAGGGTKWMGTIGNVQGGAIFELRAAVWNVSDHGLDSLVLMDQFEWGLETVEPGTGE